MEEQLPYPFVFEQLNSFRPCIKPTFGGYTFYKGRRVLLFLRKCHKYPDLNGIYVATKPKHYEALCSHILLPYHATSGEKLYWAFIPEGSVDFEQWAYKVCELIRAKSPWIGHSLLEKKNTKKIPKK